MDLLPSILAQLDQFVAPTIAPLDPPPLADRVLYESPVFLPTAMVILGIVVFAVIRRGSKKAAHLAPLALLAGVGLAAGAYFLSWTVITEREVLADRTRELIDAVARADTDALRDMIALDAVVEVRQGPPAVRRVPAAVLLGAGFIAQQFQRVRGLESHGVGELQAQIDGARSGVTQVAVWAKPADSGRTGSWWRIEWRRSSDNDWLATKVEALWIQGLGAP